jgi:hypothetical protein
MDLHGLSMEKKKKNSMDFRGPPWTSMDLHGPFMDLHGLPWISMEFINSMKVHLDSKDLYIISAKKIDIFFFENRNFNYFLPYFDWNFIYFFLIFI